MTVLSGHRVPDRVRNVDRRGAGFDRRGGNVHEEVQLRARAVLRAELDVLDKLPRVRDLLAGDTGNLAHCLLELVLAVNLRGRTEHVNASARRALERFTGPSHVGRHRPSQSRHRCPLRFLTDQAHRLEIALAGDGETRLDDVHTHRIQMPGDLDLLGDVQRGPGRLLAVAQRGVEDSDSVHGNVSGNRP